MMADTANAISAAEIRRKESYEAQDFPYNPLAITKMKYVSPIIEFEPQELYMGVAMKSMNLKMPHYPRTQLLYPYIIETGPLGAPVGPFSQSSSIRVKEEPLEETPIATVLQKPTLEQVRSSSYNRVVDTMADDPYDEELSEIRFLRSRPVAFMVVGKPCLDNLMLAQKIAEYWGAVCIDPESSLHADMATDSPTSLWCQSRLRQGLSVPSSMVMRLMERRVLGNEVAHRGYVLSGLPFLPACPDDPSVQEQIDMVLGWHLQPSVFIYIMCPEEDVVNKNRITAIDHNSGNSVNKNIYQVYKQLRVVFTHDKRTPHTEDFTEQLYADIEKEKKLVDEDSVKHLVWLPQDRKEITHYRFTVLETMERLMSQLDPQWVIRVDGRTTSSHMFRIVKARLDVLPLRRAFIPKRMKDPPPVKKLVSARREGEAKDEEGEEGLEEEEEEAAEGGLVDEQVEEEEEVLVEDSFPKLSALMCPGPKYRWRLSHWGFHCPVALQSGRNVEGTPVNSVRFLDKLYFLSSPEALEQFVANPRPYLMPPNPQPVCKVYVVGPPYCGKSAVSSHVAQQFNGKVLTMPHVLSQYTQNKQKAKFAANISDAREEARRELEEEVQARWESRQEERMALEEQWDQFLADLLGALEQRKAAGEMAMGDSEDEDVEGDPIVVLPEVVPTSPEAFASSLTARQCETLLGDPDSLLPFRPIELSVPLQPPEAIFDDNPYIQKCIQEAEELGQDEEVEELTVADWGPALVEAITEVQTERTWNTGGTLSEGGWVMDGMPLDPEVWQFLDEAGVRPEAVICLHDLDPEFSYLMKKLKTFHTSFISTFVALYPGYIPASDLKVTSSEALRVSKSVIDAALRGALNDPEEPSPADGGESLAEQGPLSQKLSTLTGKGPTDDPEEVSEEVQLILEQYSEQLQDFEDQWEALKEAQHIRPEPTEIDVNGKPLSKIMAQVAKIVEARYRMAPERIIDEDVEEEAENVVDEGEEEEEEAASVQSKFAAGDTAHYCPVVFRTKGVLWPGKTSLSLKFRDKLYAFSSEDALERFQQSPWEFAPHRKPVHRLPPLRICIVGPVASGKTIVGAELAFRLGTLHRDFSSDFDTILTPSDMPKVGRKYDDVSGEDNEAPASPENVEDEEEVEENPERQREKMRSALRQYLKEGMPVPERLVPCVLAPLWETEPYYSWGFVYSGFPMHPQDFDTMKTHCFIPDVIIQLQIDDFNIIEKRVGKEYVEAWKARVDIKKKATFAKEKKNMQEWKEASAKRIQELLEEYRAELELSGNADEVDADEDETDEDDPAKDVPEKVSSEAQILKDIKESVLDELPRPEREPHDWETVREARERIQAELQEWMETDQESLDTLKALAEEENIPWLEVNAVNSLDDVCNEIVHHIAKFKQRSPSMLENTVPLSMDQAEQLLQCGYMFLSKFSRWCPVQVYKKEVPLHMYAPLSKKLDIYPVAHRRYIYFLAGQEHRDIFMKDPIKYTNGIPDQPLVPVKMAVVGPPKSGKSTVCARLCSVLGLKRITPGQSVRYVLDELSWTDLADTIQLHLQRGESIPARLVVHCIEAATMDPRCITQGFVLDGFPNTIETMQELANASILPFLILVLDCDLETCRKRLKPDANTFFSRTPLYSPELFQYKYEVWRDASQKALPWMQLHFQNVEHLDGEHTPWWLGERCRERIFSVMRSICTYFRNIDKDMAVRLDCMCVTQQEFEERQSVFGSYCPGCLKQGRLQKDDVRPSKEGLVQYQEYFYWMCPSHLSQFMKNPELFVPPLNTAVLPEHIPIILHPNEVDRTNVAKGGYCIVTYCENLPQRRLVEGTPEYAASYKDLVFLFASAECRDRFYQAPEKYYERQILQLERSLPPVQANTLPCMGFLEQMASSLIHRAVTIVGTDRPKYPGLSNSVSAAIHIGYYLKAMNPNTPLNQLRRYENARNQFLLRCRILERVYQASRVRNPFSKYTGAGEPCQSDQRYFNDNLDLFEES